MHLPIASANNVGTALPICFATPFLGPRIFYSALYFLRDLCLMSRTIASVDWSCWSPFDLGSSSQDDQKHSLEPELYLSHTR
jgi:hypothetical protein